MIKEDEYSVRPFIVVTRKELGPEILRPEQVLLSLPESKNAKPIDLGCFCFSKRMERKLGWNTNRETQALPVVLESFIEHRREFVARYLDKIAVSGLRDESICSDIRAIMRTFDWADANNHTDFLASEEAAEQAYIGFTDYLYHQIQNDKLGVNTAARCQKVFMQHVIGLMFPDAEYRIKRKTYHIKEQNNVVRAPSQHDVREYLDYLVPFIRGLRKALMNDDFPLIIKDGKCNIHLFSSTNSPVYSPSIHGGNSSIFGIFDLANGRLLSLEEYVDHKVTQSLANNPDIKSTKSTLRTSYKSEYRRALKSFNTANTDKKNSFYRIFWAQKVIRGYAQLLQFLTGMNPSQLVNLKYEDAISVSKGDVKKDLVAIKYRARGRVESYPLGGAKGLKSLREYLEFRDWLLGGEQYDLLFFTNLDRCGVVNLPVPLRSDFQSRFYKQLKGKLFPEHVKNISLSAARKYKNIALEHIGATEEMAASHLNHSLETNRRHYSAPNIDDSTRELAEFWGAVKRSAEQIKVIASDADISDQEITVGHCEDLGNPKVLDQDSPLAPNCQTQFGCLYCENYVCHADAEDLRKLMCLKYVIKAVREQADEFQAADDLFRGLCLRIEAVLVRMVTLYPEMDETIDAVRNEVFDLGILTPFWESRLSRYEEMGVLL